MQSTRNLTKGIRLPLSLIMAGMMLFPAACQKEKKPDNVMSEKDLSAFLVEVYLAEAKLGQIRVDRDSSLRLFMPYEKALLQKRKIDSTALKETYRYYLNHPAEFEKIYETVMDTLSLREQRAQAAMRSAPPAKDTPETRKAKKKDQKKATLTPAKTPAKSVPPNKNK